MSSLAMSSLDAFGLFAVAFCLLCYTLEPKSHWYILGFTLGCILGSIYGFLQGAWPFGLVEAVWTVIAFRRWLAARKAPA